MDLEEFSKKICNKMNYFNIAVNDKQIRKFYDYMQLLLEWNEKMNLTTILDQDEIIVKHFIDSVSINKFISKDSSIIDIGTGAGFPGIPIKIINENTSMTLLDSLNKRIIFLEEIIKSLDLKNIIATHGRAEDFGKNSEYRQKFDYATSRAVAPLNYLLEYMLPFVKLGGKCICMKGVDIEEELLRADNAISKLGGEIEEILKIKLPESNLERNIIVIKKVKDTPSKYPRKAGIPKKSPL
jgi:16S rRNA (guanine527-N7)-methyltransferase